MQTPTMRDIAKQLNISVCTVSHALNNTGRLSDDLRNKILDHARKKGYVLNRNARNLRKKAKNSIGVYAQSVEYLRSSFFFSNLMAGITQSAMQNGIQVVLSTVDNESDFTDFDVQAAVFMHPTENADYIKRLRKTNVPFIIIGRPVDDEAKYVDSNNIMASYDMYKYLLQKGHREIISVLADKTFTITVDHLTGIKKALDEHNLEFNRNNIICTDYSISNEFDELIEKLKANPQITAVVAASDTQTLKVMNALIKAGYKVPDDISVGCLSGTQMTQVYNPPITATEVNIFELGRLVGEKACEVVKTGVTVSNEVMDFTLVERDSVRNLAR
ncbi:MAG: LacI family DNA-binding transcriptional regulator [Christensenellales bacterium]